MTDYVRWIRSKVGNSPIILNFAGACILDDAGRVLLQNRSATEERWGFPGGVIEYGESAEEAAIREVLEETGLVVEIGHLIGIYTSYFDMLPNGDQFQSILAAFQCSIIGGNLSIDGQETHDLAFVAPSAAPELFNQQHQDILDDLVTQRRCFYR